MLHLGPVFGSEGGAAELVFLSDSLTTKSKAADPAMMKGRWEEQWRLEIQKLAAAEWLQCKGKSNRAKQQFQGRSKICNTKICLSINLLQQKQEVIDVGYHMFEANMLDVRWSDVKNAKSVC